jgi:micrococcal nuclease
LAPGAPPAAFGWREGWMALVAAACVGLAIGMYQAFGPLVLFAPGSEVEWSADPAATVIPEAEDDPADAEWAGRADFSANELNRRERVRGNTARNSSARVQFTRCHSGGGTNCVVDGDTFYLAGAKVRIAGIDAPETHPPRCSREARLGSETTETLQALLNSGAVTMTGIGRNRDAYGRLLRNVTVDGRDVGQAMIAAGVAREYGRGRRSWC